MAAKPAIRFGVVGMNHSHIVGMTKTLLRAGAELASCYAREPDLVAPYLQAFPQAKLARTAAEVLEDDSLQLVASSLVPDERPALAVEAMRHGKDFMSDKPGATTLEQLAQLRSVQAETGRIFSIYFGEHFGSPASVKAAELAEAGAIGRVVHTTGFGPHRANLASRPPWFFRRSQYGGIIDDIGSHQVYQFLHFTGSTSARVAAAHVANYCHPQYPELEDFGEALLLGDRGTGYFRVDWYTPDSVAAFGDGRLMVQGTEGYIELRKYVDIAGRPGDNHLFLVNRQAAEYLDSSRTETPYGRMLLADIVDRTETAMPQARCFLAAELALRCQGQAQRMGNLEGPAPGTPAGSSTR